MPGIHDYWLFVLSGILLNLTPGQDTFFILGNSLGAGRRAGIAAALGIGAGSMVHTLAAALGLSAILATSATAFTVVKLLGAAYLIYIGVRALTGELSTRAPRIFTRVEPEHAHQAAPLYDVGAVARYAERDWTRSEARASTAHSLGLGTPKALDAWLGQDESPRGKAVRDGILDAWRAASVAELVRQRPAIVAAMRAGRDADRLALELARRLRDPELYSLTIGYAEPMVALAAVQAVARDLDTGAAIELLGKAADREPIASAALLAIGRLAATDNAARQLLLDRLSDPVSGESAAAALARVDDPALAARLGARLQVTKDEPTLRRVALALRLNGSPAARDALGRLVDTKQGSVELRKEVAAWLARGR